VAWLVVEVVSVVEVEVVGSVASVVEVEVVGSVVSVAEVEVVGSVVSVVEVVGSVVSVAEAVVVSVTEAVVVSVAATALIFGKPPLKVLTSASRFADKKKVRRGDTHWTLATSSTVGVPLTPKAA
jgi:hypothetical protein